MGNGGLATAAVLGHLRLAHIDIHCLMLFWRLIWLVHADKEATVASHAVIGHLNRGSLLLRTPGSVSKQ